MTNQFDELHIILNQIKIDITNILSTIYDLHIRVNFLSRQNDELNVHLYLLELPPISDMDQAISDYYADLVEFEEYEQQLIQTHDDEIVSNILPNVHRY